MRTFSINRGSCLGLLVAGMVMAAVGNVQGQYQYTTNADNTITITGYSGTNSVVIIPSKIDGLTVSCIGNQAFQSSTLTSVTIPNSVTSIGIYAFNSCYSLITATIGNSVTNIENSAFYGCDNLARIYFNGNPPILDNTYVFYRYDAGGMGYENATAYYLPGTTNWGTSYGGLQTAVWNIFSYTTNTDNTLVITGFNQSPPPVNAITIPNTISNLTVTGIGGDAFENCYSLTNVVLGNNVTNIGYNAFAGCTNLTGITIPNGVNSVGLYAFYDCTSLTNLIIGSNVTFIGYGAFAGCLGLTCVTIPDSVLSLGGGGCDGFGVFEYCFSLTNVVLGNNVINIGYNAFQNCEGLTSITIPNSVTNIDYWAFCDCYNLTSVTLNSTIIIGIIDFGSIDFENCFNLKSLYFKGNAVSLDPDVFYWYATNNPTIYYLPGTTGWSTNYAGLPTALWLPQIRGDSNFGIQSNAFSFNINWASGMVAVVESCTNLVNSSWQPVQTNNMQADTFNFSDPNWTNNPACFYRVVWQ